MPNHRVALKDDNILGVMAESFEGGDVHVAACIMCAYT